MVTVGADEPTWTLEAPGSYAGSGLARLGVPGARGAVRGPAVVGAQQAAGRLGAGAVGAAGARAVGGQVALVQGLGVRGVGRRREVVPGGSAKGEVGAAGDQGSGAQALSAACCCPPRRTAIRGLGGPLQQDRGTGKRLVYGAAACLMAVTCGGLWGARAEAAPLQRGALGPRGPPLFGINHWQAPGKPWDPGVGTYSAFPINNLPPPTSATQHTHLWSSRASE